MSFLFYVTKKTLHFWSAFSNFYMVRREGLEPSRALLAHTPLKRACLPFHHLRLYKKETINGFFLEWCRGADLNHRHRDFQSPALPLSYPGIFAFICWELVNYIKKIDYANIFLTFLCLKKKSFPLQ